MTIEKLNLPVGRIVSGNPAKKEVKTDFHSRKPIIGEDGQPIYQWRCSIAFPKEEFNNSVWPLLQQEAATLYPNGTPPEFSWKVIDGDSPACPKGSNVPYNTREGYPGHWVVKFSTQAFAPGVYKYENGAYRQMTENEVHCGDYVVPNVTIKAHNNNDGGLYFNPNMFKHVGYGQIIVSASGGNPEEAFGNTDHPLPQGASATPVVPAAAPTGVPAAAPTGVNIPPATDFVANAGVSNPLLSTGAPVAGNQPQPLVQQGGSATTATTFPTNSIPGLPVGS